jgi:hypothetical protein
MVIHALRTAALALIGFSLPGFAQNPSSLSAVAWMTGCWKAEGKEAGSGETWLVPAGGTMLGVGRTVKAGKTVGFEFMQIRMNADDKLVFIALPSGQRETTFVASTLTQDVVAFENPSHDFPQRVIYRRTGAETMVARIEGSRDGVTRGIDFPMRRAECESGK